jgi:hypothetical protein
VHPILSRLTGLERYGDLVGLEYFVEPNAEHPRLLARVAGLSVADVIGPNHPTWIRIPVQRSSPIKVAARRAPSTSTGL